MNEKINLALIKNAYHTLSKKEKLVIDYILENSERVFSMTVSDLAKEVGVAASTIVRLCKNLGYSGFSEFKIDFVRNGPTQVNILTPVINEQDTDTKVFEKVFDSSIQTLQDTLAMINKVDIEKVVSILKEAQSIQFYGVGTSAPIAMDAYYRFMRIGYNTFYSVDSHIMRISASRLSELDVAIGISHCGKTIDTVETLKIAREKGAKTIAITSNAGSPICNEADICLIAYSDEIRYPIEAISSRLAHIAILDAICVALSLKSKERTSECIDMMHTLFKPMRTNK